MCGIFGAITRAPRSVPHQLVVQTLQSLSHRGPDDRGTERIVLADREILLGHTRLSIIDLSIAGHQPMRSACGRFSLIFNGEIYNYRELRAHLQALGGQFTTHSDTEVLLQAWKIWGEACLPRLVGMFAFAILDIERKQLTLARDAFGIKPLFYSVHEDGFWFGSEIRAVHTLQGSRGTPNAQRAYKYLVYGGYDDDESTFFEGVEHIPPGHVLSLNLTEVSRSEPRRWWWPSIEERCGLSFDQAAEAVREHFLDNVRLHLRSDVLVGAALSGGIDSSAVVCAIRQLEPEMPLHTFTFVSPGTAIDEERWADVVNAHVGAQAHKVVVDPADLARDLDDMILIQGEPFGSTSIYAQYRVFKAAREAGVVVTLDGQGADESLAGYSGYPEAYLRSLFDRRQYLHIPDFLRAWSKWPGRTRRQALFMVASKMTPGYLQSIGRRFLGQDPAPNWLEREWLEDQSVEVGFPMPFQPSEEGIGRRLVERLRLELTGSGLSSLLRHGDRSSMRWSVESRVPFLTTESVEFLLTLPESYMLSPNGETKRVFRHAMRGIVPDTILDRRDKIGFQTPEYAWLRGQGELIQDWLSGADELPFLNTSLCRQHVSNILNDRRPFSPQVWRLINYCRWAQLSL